MLKKKFHIILKSCCMVHVCALITINNLTNIFSYFSVPSSKKKKKNSWSLYSHFVNRYWYFGPLKSRWTYLRTAMKDWPPALELTVSYIEATEQNMNIDEDSETIKSNAQKAGWSFLSFLFGRRQKDKRGGSR